MHEPDEPTCHGRSLRVVRARSARRLCTTLGVERIAMQTDPIFDSRLKQRAKTIVLVAIVVIMILFIGFVTRHAMEPGSWIVETAKAHFAAVIGLSFVALIAFFIVIILEFSFGAIEFEGLGVKFRGASGSIVFWALCFLSMTVAVRLIW